MQRQSSLRSFLKKSQSANDSPRAGSYVDLLHKKRTLPYVSHELKQNADSATSRDKWHQEDVEGIETPPEKSRGRVFQDFSPVDNGEVARPLSSILNKLRKANPSDMHPSRNEDIARTCNMKENELDNGEPREFLEHMPTFNLCSEQDYHSKNQFLSNDTIEPETPAMKPLVPRLKRVQDSPSKISAKQESVLSTPGKRIKLHCDARIESSEEPDVVSHKFDWLSAQLIRDADGRTPNNPLYNRRTLYIPADALKKMTASQRQYWNIKSQYMDVVLFFKVGKFYELYELDAEIGHKELDWKMTYSGVGKCRQVGISESGIDDAIQKLVARGYKVGRVEQTESADKARTRGSSSIIKRELVRVYTPATSYDGNLSPEAIHLLALKEGNSDLGSGCTYGFAFVDCAALKFWVGTISDDQSYTALGALLLQISPKEIIFENKGLSVETQKAVKKYTMSGSTALQMTAVVPGSDFKEPTEVKELIGSRGYFHGSSYSWTSVFGSMSCNDLAVSALGALIAHLHRLMLDDALCNGEIMSYGIYQNFMRLDGQSLVNLEIFTNNSDGGSSGTLYRYLDNCITPNGKRLLRNWICHPLRSVESINDRLNIVEWLIMHSEMIFLISDYLRRLPDLERQIGQVKASIGSTSSLLLPLLGGKILKQRVKTFISVVGGLRTGLDLLKILMKEGNDLPSLVKVLDPPLLAGADGLDDALKQFEIAVDEDFSNFKEGEVKESDPETLAVLVDLFVEKFVLWSRAVDALSCIDVLHSFAVLANSSVGSMCRPIIASNSSHAAIFGEESNGPALKIKGLWHPYASVRNGTDLVPNDVYLGEDLCGRCPSTLLLTGPNMGGKSTLLRATCIIALLAQLGCYVPCEMCTLTPVDTIFTRLGANDRIMTGESTFLIECTEAAFILKNATQDSLVLLDELGRGTSSFDGYAIAYAVLRHLVEKVRCCMLFATHYHPLAKEFASHPLVKLQHMSSAFRSKPEDEDELVFLYKLKSGACPESYGLRVALMAGIPCTVVKAASRASEAMKVTFGNSFRLSEQRSEFSILHEEWLRTLLFVSRIPSSSCLDEDVSDTTLCVWHELNNLCMSNP